MYLQSFAALASSARSAVPERDTIRGLPAWLQSKDADVVSGALSVALSLARSECAGDLVSCGALDVLLELVVGDTCGDQVCFT
jgi:hypothetical protein